MKRTWKRGGAKAAGRYCSVRTKSKLRQSKSNLPTDMPLHNRMRRSFACVLNPVRFTHGASLPEGYRRKACCLKTTVPGYAGDLLRGVNDDDLQTSNSRNREMRPKIL